MTFLDKLYKTASAGLLVCTVLAASFTLTKSKQTMEIYHEKKKDPNFKLRSLPKAEEEIDFDLVDEDKVNEVKKQ